MSKRDKSESLRLLRFEIARLDALNAYCLDHMDEHMAHLVTAMQESLMRVIGLIDVEDEDTENESSWTDIDMKMAYHSGYDDALAKVKPNADKVVAE